MKRQLETRSQKYNDLLLKFEDKTRQIDTMHIYAQRLGKRPSEDTPLPKSRSLQSLNDTSSRLRDEKKRREQQEQERKSRSRQQQTIIKNKDSPNDEKSLTTQNGKIYSIIRMIEISFQFHPTGKY